MSIPDHRRSFCLLSVSTALLIFVTFWWVFYATAQATALTASDSALVEPLPKGCIGGTPPGQESAVCCISGVVIVDGQPISGAVVSIADAQGVVITVTTQVYEGLDTRPQYVVDLSRLTRPVTPTNVITLVASYSGISSPAVQHIVQPGGQNRNLIVYDPNTLAMAGQVPGQAEPGKFERVRHVATDSQGNVYAVDWMNARIQVFTPDGELLRVWGEPGILPHQFVVGGIAGIAIDKSTDTVYVADSSNQQLKLYTTAGDHLKNWAPPANARWAFNQMADIAVDPDGYVYVLAYRGGLYKFAPDGTWLPWPQWPNDPADIWSNVVHLIMTPNGNFYSHKGNTLYRFDAGVPVTLTTQLLGGKPLSTTYSMASDAEGYLYVAERPSGTRVIKLAVRPNNLLEQVPWAWQPDTTDRTLGFHSMVIHNSNLYITGDVYHRIWQFALDGRYLSSWGGQAINPGQVSDPRGLAISPLDDSLYLADCATGLISKLVADQIAQSWNAQALGITEGGFCPVGVTFDKEGRLLLVDNLHMVRRFTTNTGQLVFDGEWGRNQLGNKFLLNPSGIASDSAGYLYIAEFGNRRVTIAGPATTQLQSIQTVVTFTGTTPSNALVRPRGIAVDVDPNNPDLVTVYIADPGECQNQTGRLLKFTFTQGQISNYTQWSPSGWDNGSGPFICPTAVYVRDGYLYATINYQTSNAFYVYKLDQAGQIVARYGTLGRGPGQFVQPLGVAVNSKGEMWVSDTNNSRLQRFKPMETSAPVATIVHLSSASLVPGDTLTAVGAGQDGDVSNEIAEYIWTSDQGLNLSTGQTTLLISTTDGPTHPDALGSGLHRLQLTVRDNEGDLSAPSTVLVFVAQRKPTPPPIPVPTPDVYLPPPPPPATCLPGGLWTFLLYLDADYKDEGQLARAYENALTQLDPLDHACIQVALQLDGPGAADTRRLYKAPGQPLKPSPNFTATEVAMDNPHALSDFIAWGQQQLPADHYYLALANHGDGLRGTLWDHTSQPDNTAYLRVAALRNALADPRVLPIDILHLDSCSMGLLEVAYQLRDKVQYLIASQYLGWSFFAYGDYARYAGDYPEPAGLAQQIVKRYGALAASYQLPATLAVLDLRRIEVVKNGLDDLAIRLKAWVGNDDQSRQRYHQLEAIRQASQRFDSNGNYKNDDAFDAYVDLLDWLVLLRNANINREITTAAARLQGEFDRPNDKLILENFALGNPLPKHYADGQLIDLSRANGISIYYPLEGTPRAATATISAGNTFTYTQLFADYLDHKLFDFTRAAHWDEFLRASFGTPPADPAQLEPPLPPAAPLTITVANAIYLPVVMR